MKSVLATVVGIAVVAALAIGVWQLGWFVEAKNTDRRTQVNDRSQGRQQALTSKVLRDIRTVRDIDANQESTPELAAQRQAIVDGVCDNAALLTGNVTLSASAETFIAQECP